MLLQIKMLSDDEINQMNYQEVTNDKTLFIVAKIILKQWNPREIRRIHPSYLVQNILFIKILKLKMLKLLFKVKTEIKCFPRNHLLISLQKQIPDKLLALKIMDHKQQSRVISEISSLSLILSQLKEQKLSQN